MSDIDSYKQRAADQALDYVQSGMVLGLGSGSTANRVLRPLSERLRDGRLRDIVGVATSEYTASQARSLGIPLATLEEQPQLDLVIDGADEIDPMLNLIKGLGGALLREKIVAASARRFVVVADETKVVEQLGTHAPLPVEVVRFGLPLAQRRLAELGCTPVLRRNPDGSAFETDEGNVILDCRFQSISEATVLNAAINGIPSVVEHGLFIGMATIALVAGVGGVATMVRSED